MTDLDIHPKQFWRRSKIRYLAQSIPWAAPDWLNINLGGDEFKYNKSFIYTSIILNGLTKQKQIRFPQSSTARYKEERRGRPINNQPTKQQIKQVMLSVFPTPDEKNAILEWGRKNYIISINTLLSTLFLLGTENPQLVQAGIEGQRVVPTDWAHPDKQYIDTDKVLTQLGVSQTISQNKGKYNHYNNLILAYRRNHPKAKWGYDNIEQYVQEDRQRSRRERSTNIDHIMEDRIAYYDNGRRRPWGEGD